MPAILVSLLCEAIGPLIAAVFGIGLIFLLGGLSTSLIVPMINACGDGLSNWITIPIVNEVILWGQAISIVIAVTIRVIIGIKEGIFADGGPRPVSLGEYVFKSLCSVVLVGLMPIMCSIVMQFGVAMFSDIVTGTAGKAGVNIQLSATWSMLFAMLAADDPIALLIDSLAANVIVVIALAMCVCVLYQLCKRQIQMLMVAVVSPWVGIKAATNSDSSQYWDFLTSLFGMCVIQWVQYLFMLISLNMLSSFLGTSSELFGISMVGDEGMYLTAFWLLASFGATLSAPSLLDRYTFISGGGAGNMALGMLMRGGMGSAGRMGGSVGRAATSFIK